VGAPGGEQGKGTECAEGSTPERARRPDPWPEREAPTSRRASRRPSAAVPPDARALAARFGTAVTSWVFDSYRPGEAFRAADVAPTALGRFSPGYRERVVAAVLAVLAALDEPDNRTVLREGGGLYRVPCQPASGA